VYFLSKCLDLGCVRFLGLWFCATLGGVALFFGPRAQFGPRRFLGVTQIAHDYIFLVSLCITTTMFHTIWDVGRERRFQGPVGGCRMQPVPCPPHPRGRPVMSLCPPPSAPRLAARSRMASRHPTWELPSSLRLILHAGRWAGVPCSPPPP